MVRISVVTTCRNAAPTIGAALDSVRAQRYPDVEHIVVDGRSTDSTLQVVRDRGAHVQKLISEPDKGIYDGLNKGIRLASGDVVGFLHADDMLADSQVLQRIARAFEDPGVHAVYGDLVYVDRSQPQKVLRYWQAGTFTRERLLNGWMPPHPTFYVRRQLYERWGGFDTRYRISADYDNMLRLLWRGGVRPAYVPEVLVRMRSGGISNRSVFTIFQKSCEDWAALRQNQLGGMKALLFKNMTKLPQFVVRKPVLPACSGWQPLR